jgi:hypothetical protein
MNLLEEAVRQIDAHLRTGLAIGSPQVDLLVQLVGEIERLSTPVQPDTEWTTPYPPTVNDLLAVLSAYIADVMPVEAIPDDEHFATWERRSRLVLEPVYAEIAKLQAIRCRVCDEPSGTMYCYRCYHELMKQRDELTPGEGQLTYAELRQRLVAAEAARTEAESRYERLQAEKSHGTE